MSINADNMHTEFVKKLPKYRFIEKRLKGSWVNNFKLAPAPEELPWSEGS